MTWRGGGAACPISTGRGTRRVHLVRGGGGRGAACPAHHGGVETACKLSRARECRGRGERGSADPRPSRTLRPAAPCAPPPRAARRLRLYKHTVHRRAAARAGPCVRAGRHSLAASQLSRAAAAPPCSMAPTVAPVPVSHPNARVAHSSPHVVGSGWRLKWLQRLPAAHHVAGASVSSSPRRSARRATSPTMVPRRT